MIRASKADMSGDRTDEERTLFRRVPVIVRSWDGPNSRVGLEMDLAQMPWGPFDALGKRLSLLLPAGQRSTASESESQVERALRHVEHASERCGEFARIANGNQELWLRSQETWEWIRKYLTALWVDADVEGRGLPSFRVSGETSTPPEADAPAPAVPVLPGAASTLRVAARALRSTPLSVWRENVGPGDLDSPTREEAVQTLLGVAGILSGEGREVEDQAAAAAPPSEPAPAQHAEPETHESEEDSDQLAFEFARGYDEGYQMGRRVGLALGRKRT